MGRLQSMNNANRVVFNSAVLYAKIIINVAISLISVPIIMHALGNSDYGLYSLVAGVIGLLAFLKSAMTVSTQRFISVAIGEGKKDKINGIYNTSLALHLVIAAIIVVVFELFALFMFDGFLNIEPGRETAAKIVYQFLVVTTFLEIACVPYEGVMNANEDMLAFSIIGIVSAVLKLLLALNLRICGFDRLIVYGLGMALVSLFTVTTYIIFTRVKYKDLTFNLKKYFDKPVMKEILGFTGWNTFGAVALVGRNQGVAIVLNKFFGTVLNAAYGVANQVNGVMGYFSNSFHKAITPQLMKSHGQGDDQRMIRLSIISSKFSVLVMGILTVPLILEMSYILIIWLGTPPEYTVELCQWILILSLVNQSSTGLMNAISASGKIMKYQIVMSILILSNVPISYLVLKMGMPPYYCTIGFVVVEIVSLVARMIMARNIVGIEIRSFVLGVIIPSIICCVVPIIPAYLIHYFMNEGFLRTIIVFVVYITCFSFVAWKSSLLPEEKTVLTNLINRIVVKIKKH